MLRLGVGHQPEQCDHLHVVCDPSADHNCESRKRLTYITSRFVWTRSGKIPYANLPALYALRGQNDVGTRPVCESG